MSTATPAQPVEFERIISYIVMGYTGNPGYGHSTQTNDPEYKRLQQSLVEGWRVVNVISTTAGSTGGAGTSPGGVVVTVILGNPAHVTKSGITPYTRN